MSEQDPKDELAKFKRQLKKKKMAVPEEFLDNAKSYDDKLTVVKILTEKEKSRVILIFKKMIAEGIKEANRKRGLK
jgi:hypothetical protein